MLEAQQHQRDTLRELAITNKQRQYDTTFASIAMLDGSDKSKLFERLESLEAACYASGGEVKDATLARSSGTVRDCLMGSMNVGK